MVEEGCHAGLPTRPTRIAEIGFGLILNQQNTEHM